MGAGVAHKFCGDSEAWNLGEVHPKDFSPASPKDPCGCSDKNLL